MHSRGPPWQLEERLASVTMTVLPRVVASLAVPGLILCFITLPFPVILSQRPPVPTEPAPSPAPHTRPECTRLEHPIISIQGDAYTSLLWIFQLSLFIEAILAFPKVACCKIHLYLFRTFSKRLGPKCLVLCVVYLSPIFDRLRLYIYIFCSVYLHHGCNTCVR